VCAIYFWIASKINTHNGTSLLLLEILTQNVHYDPHIVFFIQLSLSIASRLRVEEEGFTIGQE
jgi:hypothetical protein